jgi:thioredoxin reductase
MTDSPILDLVVVGSGPAGLTALLYASLYGLSALCIGTETGGKVKLAPNIVDYPGYESVSGKDFINHLLAQIQKRKGRIEINEVINVLAEEDNFHVVTGNGQQYSCRYLLFASGNPLKQRSSPSTQVINNLKLETINKFIVVDSRYRTNQKHVYACGECVYYPYSMEQLTTSVASAITATAMIYEDLKGEKPPILWGEAQIRRM